MSDETRKLRRREAIGLGLGTLGLGALWQFTRGGGGDVGTAVAEPIAGAAAKQCVLQPEMTEGPYWIDTTLTRRDITEGRPGLPLILALTVQDSSTCKPIANADVELWHCDAGGVYSGVAGAPASSRFLRGHQKSDASGRVRFVTIFPGWYTGRTPHIHLKVHVGGNEVHTGQLFFDEAITRAVYRRAPYSSHGPYDTSHARDSTYQGGGSRSTVKLRHRAAGRKGYTGSLAMGIRT